MKPAYYVLKLNDHYIGVIDGRIDLVHRQSQALRIPADIKRLTDVDMGYLTVHSGYRLVKVNPRQDAATSAADREAQAERLDW